MNTVRDYSFPVHRAMKIRNLVFGIPPLAFGIIMILSVLMVYRLGQYWFIAISLVMWFAAREITKKDQWLLDIILVSLKQKEYYIP